MIRPRILVINGVMPPPYGGIAKYLGRTLPELAQKGYFIEALTQRGYPLTQEYKDIPHLEVSHVGPQRGVLFQCLLLIFNTIKYFTFIWERCFYWKAPLKETLLLLNRWMPEAEQHLRRGRFDKIHVYDAPWAQGWIGYILSKKYNCPLYITTFGEVLPHSDSISLLDDISERYRKTSEAILKQATRISAPTHYCSSQLSTVHISPEKASLTYHVVDTEQYAQFDPSYPTLFRHHFPEIGDKKVILFIGQLLERKGPEVLARAFSKVLQQDQNIHALFIGPDLGHGPALKSVIDQLGIAEHCTIAGAVDETLLRAAYHQSFCFCFTTISKIECLGLVFVQAMCAGIPVIASRISGVPEVIVSGKNGLLFEPNNDHELAQHIETLLQNPSAAKEMGQVGQASALAQFPLSTILDQIETFYR
jgi:glycosyltransferase involved in cell wall biosynthesis